MDFISLSIFDLGMAASLVLLLAVVSVLMQLGVGRSIIIAAIRTTVQLMLIGLVLKVLFDNAAFVWVFLMAAVMLLVAGYEVTARQRKRFTGFWGIGLGTLSLFISTFAITILALLLVIESKPWYAPQYAIPILGMMFGNTMNGIALGLDSVTHSTWQQRKVVEAKLMMGYDWKTAMRDIRRDSTRTGLIPIINAMAAAGIVSLPGMMTGQILAGAAPMEAVKYQILIMFMIATGTGFGTILAVTVASRRLFDNRERLRLDRLRNKPASRLAG
ncbi:MAG: iron export ABC transporter permease subunit FetB [Gammaproteobacteria bacterium]